MQGAFDKAEKDVEKAGNDVDKAAAKVEKVQGEIKSTKSTIDKKVKELKKVDFWRVDKQIKLSLEIVGLNVKLGALYAGKATALAALEAVKGSLKLVPVLFQPAVLASNAAFEAAKGAVKVADLSVQASEFALQGIEEAVKGYRDAFSFEQAKFAGSLQALLGNSPIVMKTKFEAFDQPVDLNLRFTPTKPEEIGKALGGIAETLAKKAIKEIEKAFFGGSGGGGASGGTGTMLAAAGGRYIPPDWSSSGALGTSVPLRGAKYRNPAANKCLNLKSGKLEMAACKGTGDAILFRFSPKGDLVAVGAGRTRPLCLAAASPDEGAGVSLAACNDHALQKWRFNEGRLAIVSGQCLAVQRNTLKLAACNDSAKAQQWETTSIADLEKLSSTPQTSLYTISFRDPKTGTCLDGADGLLLEYACDGGDYQVFDLRRSGELRNEFECVTARKLSKGSSLYVAKCDKPKYQKFVWVGGKLKVKGKDLCIARSSKPNPFGIKPAALASCKEAAAEWLLQPTNIDPKGRILPASAMIRSAANLCIEARTKLQVDGITQPAPILWSCNGDFNQGFSFRWNGEVRSLGDCLSSSGNKAGAQVYVKDCVERPTAIDPTAFFKVAGTKRKEVEKQRWKLTKSGQLKKRGTKLCLSASPTGLQQMRFNPNHKLGRSPVKITKGKVGGVGSLLTLEKCSSSKLQQWVTSDKLPDGSYFAGYNQIAHRTGGIERCLETSGDSEYRNVIARKCRDTTYQDYALTPNGEIRQMGRCITTIKADKSFGDGYQIALAECTNNAVQKWTFGKDGRITQKIGANRAAAMHGVKKFLAANKAFAKGAAKFALPDPGKQPKTTSEMCISEGEIFDPLKAMPFIPAAMKQKMKGIASFAHVGVESCAVVFKNAKAGQCIKVASNDTMVLAACKVTAAVAQRQAFGVTNGRLTHRFYKDGDFTIKKVWIDAAKDKTVPAISATPDLAKAGNNVIRAVQNLAKDYVAAGWDWDPAKGQFRYNGSSSQCMAAPTGKGRLSSSEISKLKKRMAVVQQESMKLMPQIIKSTSARKKLEKLQKEGESINKKFIAHNKSYVLAIARCSSTSSQKWTPQPVGTTVWKVK